MLYHKGRTSKELVIAWRDLDARTSFSVTDLKKKWDMRRGCKELEANVGVKGLRNLALLCCICGYIPEGKSWCCNSKALLSWLAEICRSQAERRAEPQRLSSCGQQGYLEQTFTAWPRPQWQEEEEPALPGLDTAVLRGLGKMGRCRSDIVERWEQLSPGAQGTGTATAQDCRAEIWMRHQGTSLMRGEAGCGGRGVSTAETIKGLSGWWTSSVCWAEGD